MAYRIRELREKKKLTQEQLAQMSGVSRTTIVLLENNEEHEAMVGTLKSLAAALNVPVSKLFTQKERAHKKQRPVAHGDTQAHIEPQPVLGDQT